MSKHLGNVLEPIPLMDQHGADALRWYMACGGSPWAARRVGHSALEEIVRKVLLTYWNTASFFTLYANAESWSPSKLAEAPPYAERPLIDRWALAELHRTVAEVTASMDEFDTARVGRRLAEFLDDLSNWYVRRSRRRFWSGDASAFATLYECLETVTRLMSPVVPFTTDYVWDVLRDADAPASVHLATWPDGQRGPAGPGRCRSRWRWSAAWWSWAARPAPPRGEDPPAARPRPGRRPRLGRALRRAARADRRRAQRAGPGGPVRRSRPTWSPSRSSPTSARWASGSARRPSWSPPPSPPPTPGSSLARSARARRSRWTRASWARWSSTAEDVIVTEQPMSGWAVETGAVDTGTGETVALDLTITDELRRSGLIRDVIRLLQDTRKSTGLSISDRIDVWWSTGDADLAEALRTQGRTVADEVLAVSLTEGDRGRSSRPAGHRPGPDLPAPPYRLIHPRAA